MPCTSAWCQFDFPSRPKSAANRTQSISRTLWCLCCGPRQVHCYHEIRPYGQPSPQGPLPSRSQNSVEELRPKQRLCEWMASDVRPFRKQMLYRTPENGLLSAPLPFMPVFTVVSHWLHLKLFMTIVTKLAESHVTSTQCTCDSCTIESRAPKEPKVEFPWWPYAYTCMIWYMWRSFWMQKQ